MPEYANPALGFPKIKVDVQSETGDPTSDTSVGDTVQVVVEQKAADYTSGQLDLVLFDPIDFTAIITDCSNYNAGQKKTFSSEYSINKPGPLWLLEGDEDFGGGCDLDSIYNGVAGSEFGFVSERVQLGYQDAININNISVSSQDLTITAEWDIDNTYQLEVYGLPTLTVDGNSVNIPPPSGEDNYNINSGNKLSKTVEVDMGGITGTVQKEVCVGFDVYGTLGINSIGSFN
jgi:hypothetical protein